MLNLNKTDQIIAFSKELEDERSKRRQTGSELDTQKFKVKCLEEDIQRYILDNDRLSKEIEVGNHERISLGNLMKEKELLIESLRRQINEHSEMIRERDREIDTLQRQKREEQREQELADRKNYEKL